MRIAYIISHPGRTGVNRVVLDLVTLMQEHGHDCVVYYVRDEFPKLVFPCPTFLWRGGGGTERLRRCSYSWVETRAVGSTSLPMGDEEESWFRF